MNYKLKTLKIEKKDVLKTNIYYNICIFLFIISYKRLWYKVSSFINNMWSVYNKNKSYNTEN